MTASLTGNHTAREWLDDSVNPPAWADLPNFKFAREIIESVVHEDVEALARVDTGLRIADVNGDSLPDIVQSYHHYFPGTSGGVLPYRRKRVAVWLQTADAAGQIQGWSFAYDPARTAALQALASDSANPVFLAPNDGTLGYDLLDVNGDGLADLVRLAYNGQRVLLNTGTAWRLSQRFTDSASTNSIYTAGTAVPGQPVLPGWTMEPWNYDLDSGLRPLDYNNDGLVDYVQSSWQFPPGGPPEPTHVHAWVNMGDHWKEDLAMTATLVSNGIAFANRYGHTSLGWLTGDFTGDLRTDVMLLGTTAQAGGMRFHVALGQIPRLLAREVNELGGTQLLEFTTPALGRVGGWTLQSTGGIYSVPQIPVVFSQRRFDCVQAPGVEPQCTTAEIYRERSSFAYHDAVIGPRGFRQFTRVEVQNDPLGSGADHTRVERLYDTSPACGGEFHTLRRYRPDGTIAREDVQHLSTVSLPGGRSRCDLLWLSSETRDPTATVQRRVNFTSDNYGNITELRDDGFLHVPNDGLVRAMVHGTSADGRAVNLRVRDEERTFVGTTLSARRYLYDHHAEGSIGAGVPTSIERLVTTGVWETEQVVVDALGRMTSRTDADNVTQSTAYLPDSAWPTAHTSGAGASAETEAFSPNDLHGRPDTVTDRNGRVTTLVRDPFGLLQEIQGPPGTGGPGASFRFEVVSRGDPTQQYLETRRALDSRELVLRERLDGLGRVYQLEDLGAAPEAQRRVVDLVYDLRGHLRQIGLPRAASGASPFVTRDFDTLDRITRVERPGGFVVSRNWQGAERLVSDPNGNVRTEELDWRERVVSASETVSGATRTTTWTYDLAGRLTKIIDAGGATTQFGYDMRAVPTFHLDSNAGLTTYATTPAGRRRFIYRADGTHAEYSHDTLGRRTKLRTSDGQETRYVYGDSAADNTVGRIARVESGAATTTFTYDANGKVATRALTLDGYRYTASFEYTRSGELRSAALPGTVALTWTFDDFGRPSAVHDGAHPIATGVTYNAGNRITGVTYGNGLVGTFGFDPGTSRPNQTRLAGGALMDAFYAFDANGNLTWAYDAARPSNTWQVYTYDAANELTSETSDEGTETYDYDAYGNLVRMGARGYDIDPTHPHRVACVRTFGTTGACGSDPGSYVPTYDGRGNVSARGALTFSHDLLNRVTSMTEGSTTQTNLYDGTGGVAARTRNGASTVHLGEWFEQHGTYHVVHVPLGGQRVASIRLQGFVGTPVLASLGGASWDPSLGHAAGRARGFAWASLFASIFAMLALWHSRRVVACELVAGVATARRRRAWFIARAPRGAALVTVAVLAALLPTLDASVAHADTPTRQTTWYHADLVGSASLLTDETGAVVRRADFRPYGEVRSWSEASGLEHIQHGFQAGAMTESADITHMGARHYDAELGRFLEADDRQPDVENPHQLNRYAFAGGNPVNVHDPTGHGWLDAILLVVTLLAAVLVAVLTFGAGLPAALSFVAVVFAAFFTAMTVSGVSFLVSGGRRGHYITIERAMVVGLVVGVAIAASALLLSVPALASLFHVKELIITEAIAWIVEAAADIGHGVVHGVITDGNHHLGDWAASFLWATFASLMWSGLVGAAKQTFWPGGGHGAHAVTHGIDYAANRALAVEAIVPWGVAIYHFLHLFLPH